MISDEHLKALSEEKPGTTWCADPDIAKELLERRALCRDAKSYVVGYIHNASNDAPFAKEWLNRNQALSQSDKEGV